MNSLENRLPKKMILMAGPVPRKYAGVSKVAGMILDADINGHYRYVATSIKEGKSLKALLAFWGILKFFYFLIKENPKIIHLHVSKGASIIRKNILMNLGKAFRVPVVLQFHGFIADTEKANGRAKLPDFYLNSSKPLRRMLLWMLTKADGIIALSPRYAKSIQQIPNNKKPYILINPISCEETKPLEMHKNSNKILFLGDFSIRKGAYDLLESIPIILRKHPDVEFIFCGKDDNGDFEKAVSQKALTKNVLLPGFVSGAEKLKLLQSAGMFILPSYKEGVPIAILEAMAAGLPIITTSVGGIPDIVKENENGIFVKPGDVNDLATKIIFLLENSELKNRMSKINRKKAETMYDIPIYMKKLNSIYDQVLGN